MLRGMGFFGRTLNRVKSFFTGNRSRDKQRMQDAFARLPANMRRKLEEARDIKEFQEQLSKLPPHLQREVQSKLEDAAAPGLSRKESGFMLGQWTDVASSNVLRAMYEGGKDELTIEFKDGSIYQYSQVSSAEAKSFITAGSKGAWVWDNLRIRDTIYGFRKHYVLLSAFGKQRRWMQTEERRLKHGSLPQAGEPNAPDVLAPER